MKKYNSNIKMFLIIKISLIIGLVLLTNINAKCESNYGVVAKIDTVYYLNQGSTGDTIQMVTKITGFVDGQAKLSLFTDGLVSAVNPTSTFSHKVDITLDSGSARYDTLSIVLNTSGTSTLHFKVDTDSLKSTSNILGGDLFTYIEVKDVPDLSVPWWNHDLIREYYETYTDLGVTGQTINFKVTGNVNFKRTQQLTRNEELKSFEGYVRLWFVRPELFYKLNRYHPINPTSTGYIEGTHYSRIDENGNYEFDFNILTNVNTGLGWKIMVQIVKENDVFTLYSSTNHQLVHNAIGNDHKMMEFETASGYETISNSANQTFTINLQSDVSDGNILRYGAIMRKFLFARYGVSSVGTLPINNLNGNARLPQAIVKVVERTSNWSAKYGSGTITLTGDDDLGIGHEFGHYLNHAFINFSGGLNNNFTEGFADFYSFAYRTWKENEYGDETGWGGNIDVTAWQGKNYGNYPKLKHFRYEGCSKNSEVQCGFAFYLWNLYDKYADSKYNYTFFDGFNNDDVWLNGQFLFEFIADNYATYSSISNFHDTLKGYFSSNPDLQNAIQDIYDFSFDASKLMQSAQANWIISPYNYNNQWYFKINISPKTYPIHLIDDWYELTFPDWRDFSYTYPTNDEDGWKVYKENGSNWDLIDTYNQIEILIPFVSGKYKVTSYNGAGNSINANETTIYTKGLFVDEDDIQKNKPKLTISKNIFNLSIVANEDATLNKLAVCDYTGKMYDCFSFNENLATIDLSKIENNFMIFVGYNVKNEDKIEVFKFLKE